MEEETKPTKTTRGTISVSLPTADIEYLDKQAARAHTSRSYILQRAIEALKREEKAL